MDWQALPQQDTEQQAKERAKRECALEGVRRQQALVAAVLAPLEAAVQLPGWGQQAAGAVETAAAAAAAEAAEAGVYGKGTDASSWLALQAVTLVRRLLLQLWEAPDAARHISTDDVAQEAARQLRSSCERGELELVQRHVWCALSYGMRYCRGGVAGDASGDAMTDAANDADQQLPRLLLADWVCSNLSDDRLRTEELLPLAAEVYSSAGEAPPLSTPPPGRETNPLGFRAGAPLPHVAVSGRGPVESASLAAVDAGGGCVVTLPRSAATMQLLVNSAWACKACGRRYEEGAEPCVVVDGSIGVPRCLVCGVRLAVACAALTMKGRLLAAPALMLGRSVADT